MIYMLLYNKHIQLYLQLFYLWHPIIIDVWHGIGYRDKHNKNFTIKT